MKYIFTSQFLKVAPPATSFGDAWELLCLALLRAENPGTDYQHILPPDRGVDILSRADPITAYQCKSNEQGAYGSAPAQSSIESLTTAMKYRASLGWQNYCFSTNADYSGTAASEILARAESLSLPKAKVAFLGPQYWSDLCEKHLEKVQDRLDYRLQVTEQQVLDAFRKARYYEERVKEYQELIASGKFVLTLGNNRTPLQLSIPFSPDLTVRHCLEVAKQFLGVSLDGKEYLDLDTSVHPRVSITVDRIPQSFNKRMGDFSDQELGRLELWIQIIWTDETKTGKREEVSHRLEYLHEYLHLPRVGIVTLSPRERGIETIRRYERSVQQSIWQTAITLLSSA